jgi:hypothetical protein
MDAGGSRPSEPTGNRQGRHRGHNRTPRIGGRLPAKVETGELLPGTTRLTGAGYVGMASMGGSRSPVLTLEQQRLFTKINEEVRTGTSPYAAQFG